MKKLLDFLFGKDRKAVAESIFWDLLKITGIVFIVHSIMSIFNAIIGA